LLRKIDQVFAWLADFRREWNNGVDFRVKKIRPTIKG